MFSGFGTTASGRLTKYQPWHTMEGTGTSDATL
jgi:hypothetical protein